MCKIVRFYQWCQIVRCQIDCPGAKLSLCQIVRCHIVILSNFWCQIVRCQIVQCQIGQCQIGQCQIVQVPNCPKIQISSWLPFNKHLGGLTQTDEIRIFVTRLTDGGHTHSSSWIIDNPRSQLLRNQSIYKCRIPQVHLLHCPTS